MKNIFLSLLLVAAFSANAMDDKELIRGKEGNVVYNPTKNSIVAYHHQYGNSSQITTSVSKNLLSGTFSVFFDDTERTSGFRFVFTTPDPAIVEILKKRVKEFESTMTQK